MLRLLKTVFLSLVVQVILASQGKTVKHHHHHHHNHDSEVDDYYEDFNSITIEGILPVVELPETFMPGDNHAWSNCTSLFDDIPLTSTRCGDCWSTSAASATAQRLCIQTKIPRQLSNSYVLNCTNIRHFKDGKVCGGSDYAGIAETLHEGIATGSLSVGEKKGCVFYQFPLCKDPKEAGCPPNGAYFQFKPECPDECSPGSEEETLILYAKGSGLNGIPSKTSVDLMKRALVDSGPILTDMYIGPKLAKWIKDKKKKIFNGNEKPPKNETSNHIAVNQGWGVEKGVEFWNIMGDWGRGVGVNGYFRLPTGKNINMVENLVAEIWIPSKDHSYSERARTFEDVQINDVEYTCFTLRGGRRCPKGFETRSFVNRRRKLACFPILHEEVSFLKKHAHRGIPEGYTLHEKEMQIPVHCVRGTKAPSE